jgi:hypothetical protein
LSRRIAIQLPRRFALFVLGDVIYTLVPLH